MSDFILKVFPVEEVTADKTMAIKDQLINKGFISGEEVEFSGDKYLRPGKSFCDFFGFDNEQAARESSSKDIRIKIEPKSYGIKLEDEANEPEFIDRNNVVEIWNADGNFTSWKKLTDTMQQITGDEYAGDWEVL